MTADAFRRLALVAGCSGYVVALAVVWQKMGWPAAVCAFAGGALLALVVTVEVSPTPADAIDVDGRRFDPDQVRALLHRRRRDTSTFETIDDDTEATQ